MEVSLQAPSIGDAHRHCCLQNRRANHQGPRKGTRLFRQISLVSIPGSGGQSTWHTSGHTVSGRLRRYGPSLKQLKKVSLICLAWTACETRRASSSGVLWRVLSSFFSFSRTADSRSLTVDLGPFRSSTFQASEPCRVAHDCSQDGHAGTPAGR
jgi:hypothetical protein